MLYEVSVLLQKKFGFVLEGLWSLEVYAGVLSCWHGKWLLQCNCSCISFPLCIINGVECMCFFSMTCFCQLYKINLDPPRINLDWYRIAEFWRIRLIMSFVLVLMCTTLFRLYEDILEKTKTREKKHFYGDEKK